MTESNKKTTKRRLLLVWELGSGLGHQDGLLALAREALSRDCEVFAAMRQLPSERVVAEFPSVRWLRVAEPSLVPAGSSASFPQILLNMGFANSEELRARLVTWMQLIELIAPDAIVADHAPFATLAAKWLRVPHMQMGTGFTVPPPQTPMPAFRTWEAIDQSAVSDAETAISEVLRKAAARFGFAASAVPTSAGELYAGPAILRTLPCLDHYGEMRWLPPAFSGPGTEHALSDAHVQWPDRARFRYRAVAYLKADQPQLAASIQALANRRDCFSQIYVSGASAGKRAGTVPNLSISNTPFNLPEAMNDCDIVVSAGGAATTAQALLRGKPHLILPSQAEQRLTGEIVKSLNAGDCVAVDTDGQATQRSLVSILQDERVVTACRTLASENAVYRVGAGERMWTALDRAIAG
jgi:hypothetical protein